MTEEFLPNVLYTAIVDRARPVAGKGNVDQIHAAIGPLLLDRPGLAERLANLEGCPWTGVVTHDEIKVALGEHGDIWPQSIYAHVLAAHWEHEEKLAQCRV